MSDKTRAKKPGISGWWLVLMGAGCELLLALLALLNVFPGVTGLLFLLSVGILLIVIGLVTVIRHDRVVDSKGR